MSIEIADESGVASTSPLLAGLARHVLDEMRVHPLAELSVLLVDEPAMTELHVGGWASKGPRTCSHSRWTSLGCRSRVAGTVSTGSSEPPGAADCCR